ncbi:MAG: hypothetical protein E7A34_18130, partial [Leclercia adecarboxylata]|nr:hypothetical protein [Leclercia adecarboxylata]
MYTKNIHSLTFSLPICKFLTNAVHQGCVADCDGREFPLEVIVLTFEGIYTPAITPYAADGSIDFA